MVSESARWLRKSSGNPDLLCVRGKGLYGTGQLEAALKHFSEALRQDPDHTESKRMRSRLKDLERHKKAGNEAFSSGRFKEAIEMYTNALAVDPENGDVNLTLYTNRATARFKAGELDGAIDDCNRALAVSSRHIKALLRRAACHMEREDYKKAIADYEEAAGYEPDDRGIRQSLHAAKVELKKSERKDLYKVLGLTKRATEHEIRKAYKKQALQYHPDRHACSTPEEQEVAAEKFKELGEAFEVLSDSEKKARWDQGDTLEEINGQGGGHGGMGGMDPSEIFRMYAGMGGMGGGGGGFRRR